MAQRRALVRRLTAVETLGAVTLLQSTNEAFARSAIEAVKKWKYAPIGFEAIVTVTVNFTLT